jgi:hypothetical protein
MGTNIRVITINEALDVDQYPIPNPTDLFASIANGKVFSKLDLLQAYQLNSESEKDQHPSRSLPVYQIAG